MTDMVPTVINERWTLSLPSHRSQRLEWPSWERERLAAMHDLISRPPLNESGWRWFENEDGGRDLVFDIGAEEGDFPALWASWGADVVMVEPNPKVWPNIRAIFLANGLESHVRGWFVGFAGEFERDADWNPQPGAHGRPDEPLIVARGRIPGEPRQNPPEMTCWPLCSSGPVIGDHGFLVLPERPDVPVTTIDSLALDYGSPTVITIDVEGAELTVLRGASYTLQVAKPAVFVSVHLDLPWIDEKYPGDTGDKVRDFMESYGYEGRWLATDHEEHWEWRHPEGR